MYWSNPYCRWRLLNDLRYYTALGNAIAGGIGTRIFRSFRVADRLVKIVEVQSPQPGVRERYEKLYSIFKNAYKALMPIYEQIASLK